MADLDDALRAEAAALGVAVRIIQTNHEGVIIDALIEAAAASAQGVVLNAAAYAHTSLAIADAVRAVAPLAVLEVHLSNTAARGDVRRRAIVGEACLGRIEGLGADGYLLALRALARRAKGA